ncbi:hypothetical protein EIN_197810 [Entamoeba invadens IP1]|uniref:FMR1-interacting protein 1 conserved domain-containing protein n=1 Tax=Entamoeba invadens IP1 TaxID=370355 RepID=A0A0A1TWY4_ENTIV|nr:hypothetical protein EIN_197810 [Entamoeba invadens IP1]ELP83838.1 hypothetical protein EIN_197810 [Entamoeba invadens IP1]|eukprot:XP_004183184.1 hypothetical protein EIN_197810 [Entamoeba invadens IP1]
MSKYVQQQTTDEQMKLWLEERRKRFPRRKPTQNNDEKKTEESKPRPPEKDEKEQTKVREIGLENMSDLPEEISSKKEEPKEEEEYQKKSANTNIKRQKRHDITDLLMTKMQEQVQEVEFDILFEAIDFLLEQENH